MNNQLNEQQIRKIVDDEIQKKLFQFPKLPPHKHDGVDNIQINQSNITSGNAYGAFIQATAPYITQIITGVKNPTQVFFYGIAYYSDHTSKVTIQGQAFLGKCFQYETLTSTSPPPGKVINTIQFNTSTLFYESAGAWIPEPSADEINLASAYDSGNNLVAQIQIQSFNNTSITVFSGAESGWLMEGTLAIY